MKHSKKPNKLLEPRQRKFSFFLACFGGGHPSGKKLAFDHSKKSHHHHHHRWLLSPYWSKVRLKRSGSGSKTIPFGFISGSPLSSVKSKSSSKAGLAAKSEAIDAVQNSDQGAKVLSKEALKSSDHNMIPTSLQERDDDFSQKSRKSDSGRHRKPNPNKRSNNFHSQIRSNEESSRLSKLDPLVGLFIVMLTLLIMIIWGRLCAILCTSAWFYFVPRFHLKDDKSKSRNDNMNMRLDDEGKIISRIKGEKKRIVLEGFLERDQNRQSFRS